MRAYLIARSWGFVSYYVAGEVSLGRYSVNKKKKKNSARTLYAPPFPFFLAKNVLGWWGNALARKSCRHEHDSCVGKEGRGRGATEHQKRVNMSRVFGVRRVVEL